MLEHGRPTLLHLVLASICVAGPLQSQGRSARAPLPTQALGTLSRGSVRAHLRFLSHDLLEGRAPGTRGGRLAEAYVASQLESIGIQPAGESDSYYQRVPLVGVTPQPFLVVGADRQTFELEYLQEFVAWPVAPETRLTVDGDLVFVGHGITAPEWEWDDYDGTLLSGQVALILVNDPGLVDTAIFHGRTLTYYGRWTYKLEQAARMGAVGAVLIHTEESATYPWNVVRNSWSGEQVGLAQRAPQTLRFASWISYDAARRLLEASGRDLELMMQRAQRRDFQPMDTGLHAAIHIRSEVRRFEAANVVGIIRGVDSVGANEAVVFTAHHDHKGTGLPLRGDSIYNGAQDNASGVAVLLATAAAFRAAGPARRSVVFLATTAEESGLLGAAAYVSNPVVPLERTAAVINIDGANLYGLTRDVSALDVDRSSLGDIFRMAASAESLAVSPDPVPESGAFYRSDHFPFARAGVPVLSVRTGSQYVDRPQGWGAEQAVIYNRERYHQPADELSEDMDLAGAVQQARVMLRTGWFLAQSDQFPTWADSSEFRSAGLQLQNLRRSR
jgi:Zn-dependent M28 family amino/carboxypeptidase